MSAVVFNGTLIVLNAYSGELTIKMFCLSSEKGSTPKGKNLLLGSKFFPLKVDPFSEGDWFARKPKECHGSYIPCKNG